MNKLLILLGTILLATSCKQERKDESKNHYLWTKSYVLSGKDTINIIDGANKKQGLWIVGPNKDSIIYINDSGIVIPSGSTTKSFIQILREKKGYKRY